MSLVKIIVFVLVGVYLFGAILANVANFNTKKLGMEGIKFVDTLNPFKWMSVVYGFALSVIMPKHVFYQYAARIFDANCKPCIRLGACMGGLNKEEGEEGCGCHTYSKMLSPWEKDYSNNWDKIIRSRKKFLEHIKEYPIEIPQTTIDYELLQGDDS